MPFPVAGHRHRVDREHLDSRPRPAPPPTGRGRSRSPPSPSPPPRARLRVGPPVGMCSAISACSRVIPSSPSGSRRPCQHLAVVVDDLDVVMVLGPVITHEQHRRLLHSAYIHSTAARRRHRRSNGQVLTAQTRGTSSQQRSRLLTTSGRTVCRKTSTGQMTESADPPAATGTEPAKQAGRSH